MKFLKEFSYPDIFQRRIMLYNAFFSFTVLGFIYASASILLRYYSPYASIFGIIFLYAFMGLFLGNIAAKLVFNTIKKFRAVYIASDLLFIAACVVFILRKLIFPASGEPLLHLFSKSDILIYAISLCIMFFAGFKVTYFLKIACGDFIDDKKGLITFFSLLLAGMVFGMVVAFCTYLFPAVYYGSLALLAPIIPTVFLLNLNFNPAPLFAQEMKDHHDDLPVQNEQTSREDLFYTYLNFSYIIVYMFLGYETILRLFGNFLHIQMLFFLTCACSLLIGFTLARSVKQAFWHIYSEMLYPVAFVLFLIVSHVYRETMSFYTGIAIFAPVSLIFGFSIYHAFSNILTNYNHAGRFKIADFSLFVLPLPIIVIMGYLKLTNLWFFILLYAIALVNIIMPGIHLMQRPISAYKKAVYFLFSLVFIPLIVAAHLYYGIALDNTLYVSPSSNYQDLRTTNYGADFITHNTSVLYHGRLTFVSNDSTIKNLKRSLVPALIFSNDAQAGTPVLVMDGNSKYFANPLIGYFNNATCIDYVPDSIVEYPVVPLSGEEFYFSEKKDTLRFLYTGVKKYRAIIDIPNLYDQTYNRFKYTSEYYSILEKSIAAEGIYYQVFNLSHCRADFLFSACAEIRKTFPATAGFLFSDYLVIMAARHAESLQITPEGMSRFTALYTEKPALAALFYNDIHPLAHFIFTDINDITVYMKESSVSHFYFMEDPRLFSFDENLINNYIRINTRILDIVQTPPANPYFKMIIASKLTGNSAILTLLKQAGLYETWGDAENESMTLMQLKRYADYNQELRAYISKILAHKEKYYFIEAVRLEKSKQWESARSHYRAILNLNKNNFEANYRMGLLSITLQNLDDAFQYLQYAMQLKKDDLKVLYQMGVLLFSSGKPQEAINYFNRVGDLREYAASTAHYLGLCYENLGRAAEAKVYYEKARQLDPNDCAIQTSLDRINSVLDVEKNRWKAPELKNQSDAEQGESFPLPINQSAREIRLNDEAADQQKQGGR